MKAFSLVLGIILLIAGSSLTYTGYETKQTAIAKIEREASNVMKFFGSGGKPAVSKINDEANMRMIGGGVAAVIGLLMIIGAASRTRDTS